MEMRKREKNSYKVDQMLKATEFKQMEMEEFVNGCKQNS